MNKRTRKSDFKFLRMWPREVFQAAKKKLTDDGQALSRPGVYILYREDEPYYIGEADDSLFQRLHTHANVMTSKYYFHWPHFSAFAFDINSAKTRKRIKEIEGILISALPRASNSAAPRWPKAKFQENFGRYSNRRPGPPGQEPSHSSSVALGLKSSTGFFATLLPWQA